MRSRLRARMPALICCSENEAIFGGVVGFSFGFVHFHDVEQGRRRRAFFLSKANFLGFPADLGVTVRSNWRERRWLCMLRFERALDWLSSAATMDMASWTCCGAPVIGLAWVMPRVRRLVSSDATRLRRQEVSARAWTRFASVAPLGWYSSLEWILALPPGGQDPLWASLRSGPLGRGVGRSRKIAVCLRATWVRWSAGNFSYSF